MPELAKKRVGRDLTSGPIMSSLLVFALPIVFTDLVQQLYSMVDLIIIGHFVGNVGTVGVNTGGEIADFLMPVATAFAAAGQIYIAQLAGAKKYEEQRSAIGTFITLMLAASLAFMVVTIAGTNPILRMLNCPPEALGEARSYMIITAVGLPFIYGYNAVCGVLRGMGESKRPLIFIMIAAVVNIFLDLLLVAVFKLGAAGTAIATVFSQIASFTAAFAYMCQRRFEIVRKRRGKNVGIWRRGGKKDRLPIGQKTVRKGSRKMRGEVWMDIRSDRQKGLSCTELGKKYHMDSRTAKRYTDSPQRPEYTLSAPKPTNLSG